jgi:hypothetical protein
MRMMQLVVAGLVAAPILAGADEPATKNEKAYTEFSKLLQRIVIAQSPKQFEYRDSWGNTIPLPEKKLPLPKLRTYLKDGDQVVLPHGAWKKLNVTVDDPAKDLLIRVKDFTALDRNTYRLALDADVVLHTEGEWQQWQRGLFLIGVGGEADAYLTIGIVCDIGVALDLSKGVPDLVFAPKISELTLDLKDIRPRGGPILTGERGQKLAAEIKGLLRAAVKAAEPQVRDRANQAIVQGLRESKGDLSSAAILKKLPTK